MHYDLVRILDKSIHMIHQGDTTQDLDSHEKLTVSCVDPPDRQMSCHPSSLYRPPLLAHQQEQAHQDR
jgi:hypothetical protein